MDGDNDITSGLSVEQERAVAALLTEPSVAKAAQVAGVGERSIFRWMQSDEAFIAAVRRARRDSFGQAIGLCQRLAGSALGTLARIMGDTSTSSSARVAAATAVLKFGREALELDDLAARVDALERAASIAKEAAR